MGVRTGILHAGGEIYRYKSSPMKGNSVLIKTAKLLRIVTCVRRTFVFRKRIYVIYNANYILGFH